MQIFLCLPLGILSIINAFLSYPPTIRSPTKYSVAVRWEEGRNIMTDRTPDTTDIRHPSQLSSFSRPDSGQADGRLSLCVRRSKALFTVVSFLIKRISRRPTVGITKRSLYEGMFKKRKDEHFLTFSPVGTSIKVVVSSTLLHSN